MVSGGERAFYVLDTFLSRPPPRDAHPNSAEGKRARRGYTRRREIAPKETEGRCERSGAVVRQPASDAGTVLVMKRQVRAQAQHAPTPIRAGIAGSPPDLIPGPVLCRDQHQSRCLQSMHPTAQTIPWLQKNACREGASIAGGQMDPSILDEYDPASFYCEMLRSAASRAVGERLGGSHDQCCSCAPITSLDTCPE